MPTLVHRTITNNNTIMTTRASSSSSTIAAGKKQLKMCYNFGIPCRPQLAVKMKMSKCQVNCG